MNPADSALSTLFDVSALAGEAVTGNTSARILERIQAGQPDWYFFFLFGLIAFYAWVRMYYGNIFVQTLEASTSFRVTNRMFKDNSLLQQQLDNLLYVFYIFCGGFLFYLLELRSGFQPFQLTGLGLFMLNIALLTGVFFSRIILLNLAGFLFNRLGVFREYLYNVFIFNKLAGIVFLPLALFMVYTTGWVSEIFYFLALGTVAVIIAMRIVRGMIFSFEKDISKFYMFLYLWALEIVPLILLWRWLEGVL